MADQHTSIVTGDNLLSTLFQRKAIASLHEKCYFYKLCEKYSMPRGEGTTMVFNGWRKIAQASSTLAEASSNSAVTLSSRKVTATIASYGRHCKITDLAEYASVIGPVEGAVKELTQSAVVTLDSIVQLAALKQKLTHTGSLSAAKSCMLSAWTAAQASSFNRTTTAETGTRNGGSAIARNTWWGFPVMFGTSCGRLSSAGAKTISSTPSTFIFRKIAAKLARQAAPTFANGRYVSVVHPNTVAGLLASEDYKRFIVNYASGPAESTFKGMITQPIHGVELYSSPNVPRYASSALSCSPILVVGEGALGVVEMGPESFKLIIKRPSEATVSEPYDLNMTVAFKMRAVAAVLNPSCGVIGLVQENGV